MNILRRAVPGSLALALALLGAAGCSSIAPTGPGGDAGRDAPTPANTTWYEHVAPVVFANCVNCHREGGIAPFALTTYEQARSFAPLMAAQTAARRMPPMPVNNDGACNTYSNARWLSADQIALFRAWVDGGTQEGDPAHAPTLPAPPVGLPRVDATLDPGVDYTPSTARGGDDYRCFLVDTGIAADSFLTGYQVVPGEPRVVHHVIVYQPGSAAAVTEAEALDAMDAAPGYPCFGGAGVNAEPRVLWAPGVGATQLPQGTGLQLVGGRRQILQIHYNTMGGAFPDHTRVRLTTAPTVARQAYFVPLADGNMRLPPGMEHAVTTESVDLQRSGLPVTVYGVLPHMHTLGRTLRVDVNSAAGPQCLVDVDRWDFHWQDAWWYRNPISLRQISTVQITCGYDTRTRTTETRWGENTSDEMCLNYLYLTVP